MAGRGGRLGRGGNRFSATIWPGFVDAMTALLMVLMFVLTIFMVVQSVLRDRIDTQDSELENLTAQVAGLAEALSVSRDRTTALSGELEAAQNAAQERAARIAALTASLSAREQELTRAESRISDSEAEIAALLAARQQAQRDTEALSGALQAERDRASAAELAVATARSEIDAAAETARLAAARREALEALIADLRRREAGARDQAQAAGEQIAALSSDLAAREAEAAARTADLSEAEAARLVDAAAAEALRQKLAQSDAELTAMTLSLEESRKRAEETLTLLAAAQAAQAELQGRADSREDEAARQAALLAVARDKLAQQQGLNEADQRRVALLNEQVARLNAQLGSLQAVLEATSADKGAAELRIEDLGARLNAALLRVAETEKARAAEETRRAALEAAEAERLAREAADLARYRSEFFGRLSQILAGREGVTVVGDRFLFSSEVLFDPGEAVLSEAGREQIRAVAGLLSDIATEIPPQIDWVLRVDGHTDDQALSGTGRYRDNWELSQARALAVVRYLTEDLGFPPERLAATGFGQFRPVVAGDSPEARAANRRIELKLTER